MLLRRYQVSCRCCAPWFLYCFSRCSRSRPLTLIMWGIWLPQVDYATHHTRLWLKKKKEKIRGQLWLKLFVTLRTVLFRSYFQCVNVKITKQPNIIRLLLKDRWMNIWTVNTSNSWYHWILTKWRMPNRYVFANLSTHALDVSWWSSTVRVSWRRLTSSDTKRNAWCSIAASTTNNHILHT